MSKRHKKKGKKRMGPEDNACFIKQRQPCHGGAKLAFSIGNVGVWGCSANEVQQVPAPLIAQIAFNRDITGSDVKVNRAASKLFRNTLAYYNGIASLPYMSFEWYDRDAPPVEFEFWKHLVADLHGREGNLIVNCVGGHGRTGTALICIAWAAKLVPTGKDAVAWLREVYCEEAVESKAQFDYIRSAGIPTKLEPTPLVTYPKYNDASYTPWTRCSSCNYYASPGQQESCRKAKKPVQCWSCERDGIVVPAHIKFVEEEKTVAVKFCQICNYSLNEAEEAHAKEIKVDICKDCEDKFGVEGVECLNTDTPCAWCNDVGPCSVCGGERGIVNVSCYEHQVKGCITCFTPRKS